MRLILIGFAASYKTVAGKILAERLRAEFHDTDAEAEKAMQMSVAEIFATRGEAEFRAAETKVLKKLKNTEGIISCGGGAPLSSEFEAFSRGATVVWLQTSAQTVRARLQQGTRPLFDTKSVSELQSLVSQRAQIYQRFAEFYVTTDGKTPEEVAEEVLRTIGL